MVEVPLKVVQTFNRKDEEEKKELEQDQDQEEEQEELTLYELDNLYRTVEKRLSK